MMSPEDGIENWLIVNGQRHGVSQVGGDWVRCWGTTPFEPGTRAVLGMKVNDSISLTAIIILRCDDGRVFYSPVAKPTVFGGHG